MTMNSTKLPGKNGKSSGPALPLNKGKKQMASKATNKR